MTEQREVAPELKARFNDWIDSRTQTGIQRYGEPLLTNNGRDARQDAFEELLDFTQYQQQYIMELERALELMVEAFKPDAPETLNGRPMTDGRRNLRVANAMHVLNKRYSATEPSG